MTNFADQHAAESLAVHIDHAAAVTVRMPTAEECARGYQAGAPVIVVADDGGRDEVFPSWVTLTFDDPHGQPEPDAVRGAAAYVLGTVSEELANIRGVVSDLAGALGGPPCRVTELAAEMREAREAEWHCADGGICELAPAVSC